MLKIRRADTRGHAHHGWLQSHHTFSFADYFDREHMGFRALRVLNDDRVAPGAGFPPHPHRDMEIVTYVLEGAIAHKDSMGNGSVVKAGDVQRMSAGTGVTHSEYNASRSDPLHFLQIWIVPDRSGRAPGYEQRAFSPGELAGTLRLVASPDGADGSLTLGQDVRIFAAKLGADDRVRHAIAPGRHAYVHVARGSLSLGGQALGPGDGAALSEETELVLSEGDGAEVLVFDLA
jgi:quercetin 2,3-dioxygenase